MSLAEKADNLAQVKKYFDAMLEIEKVSPGLAQAIRNGSKTLGEETRYVRKEFDGALGGGTVKLIDPDEKNQIGHSSFPGQMTASNDAFIITGVSARYSLANSVFESRLTDDLPTPLLHHEFRVVADGQVKTRNLGREFLVTGPGYGKPNSDQIELEVVRFIQDNKPIQIEFEGSASLDAPTAPKKHVIEVMLHVLAVQGKS